MKLRQLLTNAVLVGVCACLTPPAAAATIDGVRVRAISGSAVGRVEFDLSNRVAFQIFTLDHPDRVVVDIDGARPRAGTDISQTGRGGTVTRVRGGARGNGYRVVIEVTDRLSGSGYMIASANARGDTLVVELKLDVPGAAAPSVAAATRSSPPPADAPPREVPVAAPKAVAKSSSAGSTRDFIVAIDAGHGGQDPGAIGVGRIQEKTVALAIAKELAALFNATSGFRGDLTRSGDYYLTLRQRTTVARKRRADLFVSIHADSFSGRDATGASVYTLSAKGATNEAARWLAEKENASDLIGGAGDVSLDDKDALLAHVLLDLSMDANRSASIEAGGLVLSQLNAFTRLHRAHVEQAGFVVLKSPDIPSILVETGYLSNTSEARKLSQRSHQRKIANAVFKGIVAYAQRHPPPGTALAARAQKRDSKHPRDSVEDVAAR